MRRRLYPVLLIALALVAAAACSDDGGGDAATETTAPPATFAPASDAEPADFSGRGPYAVGEIDLQLDPDHLVAVFYPVDRSTVTARRRGLHVLRRGHPRPDHRRHPPGRPLRRGRSAGHLGRPARQRRRPLPDRAPQPRLLRQPPLRQPAQRRRRLVGLRRRRGGSPRARPGFDTRQLHRRRGRRRRTARRVPRQRPAPRRPRPAGRDERPGRLPARGRHRHRAGRGRGPQRRWQRLGHGGVRRPGRPLDRPGPRHPPRARTPISRPSPTETDDGPDTRHGGAARGHHATRRSVPDHRRRGRHDRRPSTGSSRPTTGSTRPSASPSSPTAATPCSSTPACPIRDEGGLSGFVEALGLDPADVPLVELGENGCLPGDTDPEPVWGLSTTSPWPSSTRSSAIDPDVATASLEPDYLDATFPDLLPTSRRPSAGRSSR